ncbi:hypothetical protein GALMADRAFT_145716 [Galerina marginata CBS 339.88]|uniref:F-box domain-containing protein n=1 Tax=Galerina marginata (strain CBS 339.88) TaxID=685588 RepID=A0A067SRB5_GALM3|nr:hypothetical protein GALMADRAFT_145716 [Galerina marginata CBS 339.88]
MEYMVYESVDQGLSQEDYEGWELRTAHFKNRVEWLSAHPRHSKSIRTCSVFGMAEAPLAIMNSQHPSASEVYHAMLSTLKSSLPSFTGLRSIYFQNVDMDEDVLRTLVTLPFLTAGQFHATNFECRKIAPPLTLKDLVLSDVASRADVAPLEIFSNQRLEVFRFVSDTIPSETSCLKSFVEQGPSTLLTSLFISLKVETISDIFSFFEACPSVISLSASLEATDFPPLYPRLSASALPCLRSYSGPASLAVIVVPSRPVTSVVIQDSWKTGSWNTGTTHEQPMSCLSAVAKSSAKIRTISLLNLIPHPNIFNVISQLFPDLRSLSLRFHPSTEDELEDKLPTAAEVDEYFTMAEDIEMIPVAVADDGNPVRPPESFKGLIDCLRANGGPLPPLLGQLTILYGKGNMRSFFMSCLSLREQRSAVLEMSKHFPSLNTVIFGRRTVKWVKDHDSHWKPSASYQRYLDGKIWAIY